MPNFTVIEGGGKGKDDGDSSFAVAVAQGMVATLIVEILRSIVNGRDDRHRVSRILRDLPEHLAKAAVPLPAIVQPVFADANKFIRDHETDVDLEIAEVVFAALRVAAEQNADDNAARGRLSKRKDVLRNSIESYLIAREGRSRENGWSFTENLLGRYRLKPINSNNRRK